LLAAPRSLSQLSTSFFASDCLGIHHTPFVAYRIPKARIEVAHRIRSASVTARRNRCEISTVNTATDHCIQSPSRDIRDALILGLKNDLQETAQPPPTLRHLLMVFVQGRSGFLKLVIRQNMASALFKPFLYLVFNELGQLTPPWIFARP
jgi:hypothetical protein